MIKAALAVLPVFDQASKGRNCQYLIGAALTSSASV
jgi:hypothetical protein